MIPNVVEPPLFKAIVNRDRGQIAKLLAAGADVNERFPAIRGSIFPPGATPLMIAAEAGNLKVFRDILGAGAEVGLSVADDAGRKVAGTLWKQIVPGGKTPPPRSAAQPGWTALMLAAHAGHAEIVSALLAAGAAPRHRSPRGETALSRALEQGHTEIAAMLQAAGGEGLTPSARLLSVLRNAETGQVGAALADGADPNAADLDPQRGRIPALVLAAETGRVEPVAALLAAGAEVDAAIENHRPPSGRTALMAAAAGGHIDVLNTLLKAGADLKRLEQGFLEDRRGERPTIRFDLPCRSTALLLAAERGHLDAVRVLLDGGASVNARGSGLAPTALTRAIWGVHIEVARLLIEAGADVNAGSKEANPLALTEDNPVPGMADLLRQAGARGHRIF